ncbi:MAG: metal-dependent hydrolase [Candidatus Thermoplasmatota archaeon]|nr:hypothetical protein [Euryarchaeota archaeon]MBU4031600.1 metal-dependent hydrolase [Candidatus Thermoplasmatota archaeon]MBU4071043.1 metal-dependent hydrolase [Candidatus Thermoplasmatota archaeon]MBU4145126.1 metal-dependent hydrolase [Candidatus Thermoplasmatota archaeon]MBU4591032.1 metal-dependent hydrolase [Candidatus Thermoplasmatota archaeon]
MLSTVHFIVSLGIAFCLEYRHPRRYTFILALGLIGMAPDIDHILPLYQGAGIFHNTFFMAILPLTMVMLVHLVESSHEMSSSKLQRFSICVTIILVSHLFLDLIAGSGIGLRFPTSAGVFSVTPDVLLSSTNIGTLIVTTDVLWMTMLVVVMSGNLLQKKIYALFEEYAENPLPDIKPLHYVSRMLMNNPNSANAFGI